MAKGLDFHRLEEVCERMEDLSVLYNKDGSVTVGCRLLSETFAAIAMIAREVEKSQQGRKK